VTSATKPRLILASASPRRAQILRDAGFSFVVHPTSVDETVRLGESPAEHVLRLAREKALTAAQRVHGSAVVIGADTVVVVAGKILGKPRSPADARRMLRLLSGRRHRVFTGIAALRLDSAHAGGRRPHRPLLRSAVEVTHVWFARLTPREIEEYVASGEPMDKAGAYAVQGRAGRFITRIEGCYFNVVGLPLALVTTMLESTNY
jgi:nucleoside triphosphate pyrophosphatase